MAPLSTTSFLLLFKQALVLYCTPPIICYIYARHMFFLPPASYAIFSVFCNTCTNVVVLRTLLRNILKEDRNSCTCAAVLSDFNSHTLIVTWTAIEYLYWDHLTAPHCYVRAESTLCKNLYHFHVSHIFLKQVKIY